VDSSNNADRQGSGHGALSGMATSGSPTMVNAAHSLEGALRFSTQGGGTGLPEGYTSGRVLISNLPNSPLQGTRLMLEPYQAVVLVLEKD